MVAGTTMTATSRNLIRCILGIVTWLRYERMTLEVRASGGMPTDQETTVKLEKTSG